MNKSRAREIAKSSVMANVTYNGTPIYIERVDEVADIATIHPLSQPSNTQRVPLDSLTEH